VEVGIMPLGVAITPDGKRVYVANEWDWTVSVIDTETNLVIETVNLPPKSTTPIITWSKPKDILYGTALNGTQLNAVATDPYTRNKVLGTSVYTPAKGTKLDSGTHTLHVDFIPEDASAYNKVSKNVTINVQKSTPVISWSKPDDITYGTALSSTQLNAVVTDPYTGNVVLGTPVYTPAKGTKLDSGTHTLYFDFTPEDASAYNKASKNVTINVQKSTPKVTWDEPDDIIYGKALSSTQLNAVATDPKTEKIVLGTYEYYHLSEDKYYKLSEGAELDGGTYTLHVDFTPKDAACYTSASKNVTINVLPNAEFSADVIFGPPPLTVKFTDESTGNPTEWKWNFGDGGTSTDQSPEYTYKRAGVYKVTETAINSAGRNKETKINYYVSTKDKKTEVDYINVTTDDPEP
jgi:YVTN family beta-propeller protein